MHASLFKAPPRLFQEKHGGFVYFMAGEIADELIVKIGFTRRHPKGRLRTLQSGFPTRLQLIAYVAGDMGLEQRLHRTFQESRLNGEWFRATYKLKDLVWYLCRDDDAATPIPATDFEGAIFDCVVSAIPPHPDIDEVAYAQSADISEWELACDDG